MHKHTFSASQGIQLLDGLFCAIYVLYTCGVYRRMRVVRAAIEIVRKPEPSVSLESSQHACKITFIRSGLFRAINLCDQVPRFFHFGRSPAY